MTSTTIFVNTGYPVHRSLAECLQKAVKSKQISCCGSRRIFQRKQSLFSVGDSFEGIFIMRSGSAKSIVSSVDGEEHISKFLFPGDLVGMEGFATKSYTQSVFFLETSTVYRVKETDLMNMIQKDKRFLYCFIQKISQAEDTDKSMMLSLSTHTIEQKVANFILELSLKLKQLDLSSTECNLSMSRTDIAHYLGMALETLSRVLTSFQQRQLIHLDNRQLTVLNSVALRGIVLNV